MNTYVIADTHFNHDNIISYCHRPFQDIKEMNEFMIKKWNQVVKTEDLVYHLGDFGIGNKEELSEIYQYLNGTKILIMGNHDSKRGMKIWREIGFQEVYKKELQIEKFIFTHHPIEIKSDKVNVFGHIHNKLLDRTKFNPNNHVCVSCEVISYTPILFEKIKEKLKEGLYVGN